MGSRIRVGLFYWARHMTDVAAVGIAVETDGVDKGIKKLAELAKQGPKVEQSMAGISAESKKVAKSLADLGSGAGDGLKKTGDAAQKAATGIKASGTAAREAVTDTASLARAMASLTTEEEKHIRKLVEEANGLRMTRGEMEAYRAAQRGMSAGAQEIARATGNRIEALKAEQKELAKSNDLMTQASSIAKGLFAGITFTAFATKLVSVQREFDKLNSSLITVTGGSANAEAQMKWIKEFAKETPFGLAQATEAFVKMKALGLDPSKAALTSFGNTAAAMGKDLNQMIEAVADASTGEFERLKEFGIKASKDGEQIKFTFQGISTTVRNSAEEITKYLEQIGNNQFAGAMEERARTLDGALSELGDTWDELFRTVNEQNTGGFIYDSVKLATGAIDDLTTIIREANKAMDEGSRAGQGFKVVQDGIATVFETVAGLGLNVKYVLTQVGNEIGGLVAQAAALARGDFAGAAAIREAMVADAKAAREAVDQQTENVLKARQNAKEMEEYRKQIANSSLGNIASQVDGFKPSEAAGRSMQSGVESLLKATQGYKSSAEAMAEVRKQGDAVRAMLDKLKAAGEGNSESAKQLEARLQGVNEKLEAMAKKGRDGAGAAAVKKEQGEYEKLISSIRQKILENEEELTYGRKLSEADKLRFLISEEGSKKLSDAHKVKARAELEELERGERLLKQKKAQAEAEEGYRKFLDGIYKSAEAIRNLTEQQDAANASFGKSKVAIAEMAAEQAKLVLLNEKDMGPWTPEHIAALQALSEAHAVYVASLREAEYLTAGRKYDEGIRAARDELQIQQYSMSLLGEQELKRNKMIAVRKSEIKLARELAEIEKTYMGRNDEASIKQRTDLERKAQIRATEELQVELGQIQERYVNEQVQKYDQIFSQGFADMLNNGKDGWKSFTKSLTTTFKTQVADQIYQMFARPIVVQLVGSLLGMTGGAGGLLGSLLGGGSGGGGGVMSLLSNGSSAYSLYSGEGLLGQGSRYVANMFGFGGAAPWQAAGAQASGAVTMPVTGGLGGAAPGSTSFMGLNGGYAAAGVMMIPLIAAYLGGMFKEERQVGAGITGELGGDLYGYQLMRESGSLFGGPKYRYLVAEKEIEKSKAEIERLKKEIADNPNDARNGYRERQLQQQYSRLEMLSQYDGAIEASKGPIKILQDAFTAMREDTAARADSLKLDGDSIRAMKVTLGIDEIHPDTGGKGLELTGLSQEEAAAKIQAALAQANEEMARSVLGTWQEQTREVTRMVWDNVELPSEGDTQQYGRVGREVTETVTEQVFVMGEYVRAGETAVQALTRLSDSLYSVNTVFDMLGVTLMDTSLAGADLASDIIDAFGGGDKFSAATSNYYDKFYSDQEKVQTQTRLLNEQLKKLGVETMPTSREALREYINGIDLSSEEGRKLYASLLGLVDVFDLIYTSAENIASLKKDLNVQLLRAQGNDAEALRLEREKQIKELEKYNDPELVRMQRDVWAAEDKTKADEEAKRAAETAKDLAMKNLEAAVSREKEYWNQFSADAKDSLTKASSYFDLVTNAAKSLRDSVEDSASWSAAAGMVYIEQALDRARKGGGLSDLDATKSAIEAATGGLVMDNYATQAELDYDKKVLAGQLDELGGYAELAKSDAQKQIDLANAQIKRLDDTLTFWKEYGEEQVDATLSVTDAVNALYKLLDPKEQERIRKEEAAKAGLDGGGTPGKAGSGATLGGTVSGTAGRYVVGFTADGRAKWSDGTVEKYAAGQSAYEGHLQVGSGNLTAEQWAAMQAGQSVYGSGWYFDEKQGLWMKRKSFAVGTNYVPYDMTANIHQGERIIPAADNRALMAALNTQGGGNAELITAVKKLEERLASIDHNTADVAVTNRRLDANIDQVSEGGNGLRVVNPG